MIILKPSTLWDINAARRIQNAVSVPSVSVGVPADAVYDNGEKVSDVAVSLEFGNGNVLPRPFVRNAIADKRDEWKSTAGKALGEVLQGGKSKTSAMKELGNTVKNDIVASLDNLTAPPLKERTVAAKRKKGRRNPEKPLIDSGKLRKSIKVRVEAE